MLKIKILCVGKIKEKYFAEAVSEYVKRISRFAKNRDLLSKYKKNISSLEGVSGEADTLAGLLLEIKGEFPKLHETIVCNGVAMEVEKKDKHRIVKIKVTLPVTDVAEGEDD